jgi:hypothetical protein
MMERVFRDGIREPLRWIAMAIFQPDRFRTTYEPAPWQQRAGMLARLIVPLFLLSLLLVILVRLLPIPEHILVWSNDAHQFSFGRWLVPVIGIMFGLLLGFVLGTAWGVSFGIIVSLTAGLTFGLPGDYAMLHTDALGAWLIPVLGLAAGCALGLTFGLARGLAFGIIVGLAAGIGIAGPDIIADFVIGLGFSLALNMRGSLFARLEVSLVTGIILGIIGGISAGLAGGIAGGLAAGLGSALALARIPSSAVRTPLKALEHAVEGTDRREHDDG